MSSDFPHDCPVTVTITGRTRARSWEFLVSDDAGTWGMVRVKAKTERYARYKAGKWLDKHEVYPKGSLDAKFSLALYGEVKP